MSELKIRNLKVDTTEDVIYFGEVYKIADVDELIAKKDKEIADLVEMIHRANDLIEAQRDELIDLYSD